MSRWVLASGNPGKLRELRALTDGLGWTILPQDELGVSSPAETASTFVENALIKARHAARRTGLPAIADDSGLLVDALGGAPGIHSARYAGPQADDRANVAKLLEALGAVPPTARAARFYCVIVALTHAGDPAPVVAAGQWRGRIALEPAGAGGFGYDPVFFDPDLGATAAELPAATKNRVSHRGIALRRLRDALTEVQVRALP